MAKSVGLYLSLALGLLVAALAAAPPAPRPATAPAIAFSAQRAMGDVAAMAKAPHPAGSAANARVRDHLVSRLKAMGLDVDVWRGQALTREDANAAGADVENIVAVLPGTDRALPAVAVMSHYDSARASPGAADDAAGVASSLETARALRAGGPTRRDVVVLITDAEEPGLFGASAFFAGHPLAGRIGAVINQEARGGSGPAMMFETGPGNGALIARYAQLVERPAANSLMGWVYDRMPNGTDFTLAKKRGLAGLNFAFLGTPFDYHSATATPANLDQRSLQHMGDQVLAMTRALADAPSLPPRRADAVYADVLSRLLIHYPAWGGWLVLLAAAAATAWSLTRARVVQGLAGPDLVPDLIRGALSLVLIVAAAALPLRLAYRAAPVGPDFYQSPTVAQLGLFLTGMALLALGAGLLAMGGLLRGARRRWVMVAALAMGAACCLLGGFDPVGAGLAAAILVLSPWMLARPVPAPALWGGLLLIGLVLAAALQAAAPQTAFVLAWPLLVSAGLAALIGLDAPGRPAGAAVAVLVGAAALAWLAALAKLLFDAIGLTSPEVLAAIVPLSVLVAFPLIAAWSQGPRPLAAAGLLVLAGVGVLVFVAVNDPASPRTPRPANVLHVTDAATGRSLLASEGEKLGPWSRSVLTQDGAEPRQALLPGYSRRPAWVADTDAVAVPAPTITLVHAPARPGDRVVLKVAAPGARELRLDLKAAAPIKDLTVDGHAANLMSRPGQWSTLTWQAPGDGVEIAFAPPGPGAVSWRMASVADGWPREARPLPPLPAEVMPSRNFGATVVTGQGVLRW